MSETLIRIPLGITLRRAVHDDLPKMADIHKAAYSHNHFTALLPHEVLQKYYAYFLGDDVQTLLVVESDANGDERILGFAVFGLGIPEKISKFKKDCFRSIFLASLRHPWVAAQKIMKAVAAKILNRTSCIPANFLLLSIAVAMPGRGLGRLLLNEMLKIAKVEGEKKVGLYVNSNNVGAMNTYFSEGFLVKHSQAGQLYMENNLS